jgi:putative toxin-antitoxin system antitoxin component (TIGR02293 family)
MQNKKLRNMPKEGSRKSSSMHKSSNNALVGYVKTFTRGKSFDKEDITYTKVLRDKLLLANAVRKGVPNDLFKEIKSNSPFNDTDWSNFLSVNLRTLQRYKKEDGHIYNPVQSERIFEMAEVVNMGNEVFDSVDDFKLWLETPSLALGGEKPINLLDSSYGKDLVLAELNRIEHGIFV